MLNDLFYFLKLFEGSNKRLGGNQIEQHLIALVKWGEKEKCWP